jgi:hypothetical protein
MSSPRFEVAERNVLREWGQQKLNEIAKKMDGQEVNIRADDFLFRTAVKQYGEVRQDADVRYASRTTTKCEDKCLTPVIFECLMCRTLLFEN